MEAIISFFQGDLLGFFLKLFGIVIGMLYVFFSIIIIKQVNTMKNVVTINDSGLLIMMAYVQLGLALLVVGFALVIL